MSRTIQGGCPCGAIRYLLEAPPEYRYFCCCRDCQSSSGTDKMFLVTGPRASFRLMSGEPRSYAVTADHGATIFRAFCRECGSSLLVYPEIDGVHHKEEDDVVGVAACSLDGHRADGKRAE